MSNLSRKKFLLAFLLIFITLNMGCPESKTTVTVQSLNDTLELEARLTGANFSLLESEISAVESGKAVIERLTKEIPSKWKIEFAGSEISSPNINDFAPFGISHSNGRSTVIYVNDDFQIPEYGKFEPLAYALYTIPEKNLEIFLLLVCFQTDQKGSVEGLAVRSLDVSGRETSAPFAIALKISELKGLFFYDDFIESNKSFAIAGRPEFDRGFLILSRVSEDAILSTYLPWY